jgi:hypothetical protein
MDFFVLTLSLSLTIVSMKPIDVAWLFPGEIRLHDALVELLTLR